MFDFLAFIIGFFLISFLVLIILIGIKFFCNLANIGHSKETDNQLIESSKEDSQADGLLGIGESDDYSDILFPEEPDEEEN